MPARGGILKAVAPECIDACGGLFVAVEGDDPEFAARFPQHCRSAGIECTSITPAAARELEPCLSEKVFAAYTVPDAAVDPFRITLENVNHARQLTQSILLSHTELERFVVDGGAIRSAICRDTRSGETVTIHARQVVNAAGAWAMRVARLAGCSGVNLLYSKGTPDHQQRAHRPARDQPPAPAGRRRHPGARGHGVAARHHLGDGAEPG